MIGHGVAETEEDALALFGETARRLPPEVARFFCPLSEAGLYRKVLQAGHRAIKVMNRVARSEFLTRNFMLNDRVFYPLRKAVGAVRWLKRLVR